MGALFSSEFNRIYSHNDNVYRCKSDFELLGIYEEDAGKMYKTFLAIDNDASNEIAVSELCYHIKHEENNFTKRIFNSFDSDKSNYINFKEFVLSLWNFCTLTEDTMVPFVFAMYDSNGSGVLDKSELECIVKDVYGKRYFQNIHAMKMASKLKSDRSGDVGIDNFAGLCKKYTALLYPAFTLRLALRSKILGEDFWIKLDKFRRARYGTAYHSVESILRSAGSLATNVSSTLTAETALSELGIKEGPFTPPPTPRNSFAIQAKPRKKSIFAKIVGSGVNIVRTRSKELATLIADIHRSDKKPKRKPVRSPVARPGAEPKEVSLTEGLFK